MTFNMLHALVLTATCALAMFTLPASATETVGPPQVSLSIDKIDRNVLDDRNPDMAGIKWGVEGGEIRRDDQGQYHFFTSEQYADPYWVANRIAHWTSDDGIRWRRDVRWTKAGNQDQTGTREKSDLFDPTLVYDEKSGSWYMFYVAYRYSPAKTWFAAKIYRAKAMRPGRDGLGGPYHDNDADDVIVMGPIDNPGTYEAKWIGDNKWGLGAASATVYQTESEWTMLWSMNMIATAPTPAGAFTRLPEGPDNPVTYGRPPMDWAPDYLTTHVQQHFYHENPVIIRLPRGGPGASLFLIVTGNYVDVSIGVKHSTCGYATSKDGRRWSELRPLNPGFGNCMTVLGVLPETNGSYTMFITSHDPLTKPGPTSGPVPEPSYERVSKLTIKVGTT